MSNKTLKSRTLKSIIFEVALKRNKMAFISGPRQVGKTTLSQSFSSDFKEILYKNWDTEDTKRSWSKNPSLLFKDWELERINSQRLLILDEIHKSKNWKSKLKGIYDIHKSDFNILVTGSARLDTYKKGSDSLLGRVFNFRLHPFSLRELLNLPPLNPIEFEEKLKNIKNTSSKNIQLLNQLFERGGFPEPFYENDEKIRRLWKRGRKEKIIKEDLRDISRIEEISNVETLCALLPEKIGSPLSIQSLREDLSVAHGTISRWLKSLRELYYHFDVSPYSKSIARSLKKEPKIYFYDWAEVETPGPRFENMVASHLLKSCHFWEDTGEGEFALHYLRNKEKNEIDFLVLKNKKPWFTVECKLSDSSLDPSHLKFQQALQIPHFQIVNRPDLYKKCSPLTTILSADIFLALLV